MRTDGIGNVAAVIGMAGEGGANCGTPGGGMFGIGSSFGGDTVPGLTGIGSPLG